MGFQADQGAVALELAKAMLAAAHLRGIDLGDVENALRQRLREATGPEHADAKAALKAFDAITEQPQAI